MVPSGGTSPLEATSTALRSPIRAPIWPIAAGRLAQGTASVLLSLSEHEGFCVPLLEAFALGVPVIARPAGGIPEVAGDAALLVSDGDPAVVAELLHLAVTDADLRRQLRARGAARARAYDFPEVARRLRDAVEGACASASRSRRSR